MFPTYVPTSALVTNSTDIEDNSYIFRISIYGVLIVLLTIIFIVSLVRKIKRVCHSSSQSSVTNDYETVAREDRLIPQDNPAFEHHVNVDALDVQRRLNRYSSEYDYYSDEDDTDNVKDKPPPYEDPPPYSSVSYED